MNIKLIKQRFMVFTVAMASLLIVGNTAVAKGHHSKNNARIVAFGDSLSDNGNADGYGFGVWSDGEVWLDYLADEMNAELDDRALGGAMTSGHNSGADIYGLDWQVDEYIGELSPDTDLEDTLFVVWAGGNDFLSMAPGADPSVIISNAVNNILFSVQSLIDAGAKEVLVMNLPNLGLTPLYASDPAYSAGASYLAQSFNGYLKANLCPLTAANPDVEFHMIDTYELMNYMVLNQDKKGDELFDFTNGLFWDAIHPTTTGHQIIAAAACKELKQKKLSKDMKELVKNLKEFKSDEFECQE